VNGNKRRIGFMQGRLSPLINGRIQAFPWRGWEDEFPVANALGMTCMEWTLDQDRIFENPVMTEAGRANIRRLSAENGVRVPSLTADCCMRAPFWKASGTDRSALIATFQQILLACADVGIKCIVVPLVDNGAPGSAAEWTVLEKALRDFEPLLRRNDMVVAFEFDLPPCEIVEFIARLSLHGFGINYDIGNSASLGWDPKEEIGLLASRIVNVHVKDRLLGGTTVPLGEGAAQFLCVFALLGAAGYDKNFILQTARAADGEHIEAIRRYGEFVAEQIGEPHGS
jgi:L-ribulose-5-phosphate 3-epimerase